MMDLPKASSHETSEKQSRDRSDRCPGDHDSLAVVVHELKAQETQRSNLMSAKCGFCRGDGSEFVTVLGREHLTRTRSLWS